jgi:hypothetical protein
MKKRLWKDGAITTILGLAVLGFAGYIVLQDMNNGQSAQEAIQATSGWIAVGGLLIRSKNSLLTSVFKKAEAKDNGSHPD